ncbi:MAG: FMN-binding negative transcriptional regulator, partial [Caulobacterales bacterium]|nr:FMN-binding negative transcriptional regulator [Caulobacterales bacterium]
MSSPPEHAVQARRGGFTEVPGEDVLELITRHPFAWVNSMGPDGMIATAIPVRPLVNQNGSLVGLAGHFARANRHVGALERDGRALFLFTGPHAYFSPSWYQDRSQAPTWNFATVQIAARVVLTSRTEDLRAIINDLV